MLQRKLVKLKIKMNRNLSLIAKETHHMQKQTLQDRKLRTRTLIQVGGLLSLSGLLQSCNIVEGEDLQNDLNGHAKAATLLGILMEANDTIFNNDNAQQLENYKILGEFRMKQAVTKYV